MKIGAVYGVRVPVGSFDVETMKICVERMGLCLKMFKDDSNLYIGAPIPFGDGGPFGLSGTTINELREDSSGLALRLKNFAIDPRYLFGRTVEESLRIYDVCSFESV